MPDPREQLRATAHASLNAGDPTGWFETIYREAGGDPGVIPWANLAPNPHLQRWLARAELPPGGRALVIGCGLGDDAEALATRGVGVSAFDVAPTAIHWARRRFPASAVEYRVADLFAPPPEWRQAFDLVVEINTVQALPLDERRRAMGALAGFLRPGGILFICCRARDDHENPEGPPWPLSREELAHFRDLGLREHFFEELFDGEQPPVRRFIVEYRA